jgi:hypothetical protein
VKISKDGTNTTLTLDAKELPLFRMTIERANFIDTPPEKQEAILAFGAKLLDQLAAYERA